MYRRRSIVALVVAVLLIAAAGCGSLDSTDDRELYGVDDEVDPAAISGLNEEEITDPVELRNAHVEALLDESYRKTVRETIRNDSGVVPERSRAIVYRVAEGGTPALIERRPMNATTDADRSRADMWIDDGTGYMRYTNGSDSETARFDSEARDAYEPTMPISLVEVYDAVETVESTGDGYRLEGAADSLGWYENATVTVTLTPEGIVETYHVEGTYVGYVGERYDGELVVEIERAEVDLEEPPWVEEARDEAESDES